MFDIDTFLVTLYVTIDDFCSSCLSPEPIHPGPTACLSRSEVVTLGCFSQLSRFQSERDFWRFAHCRLRPLFPCLPDRTRFNRLMREHEETIIAFSHHLSALMGAQNCAYEIVDRTGVATRWCNRRGVGWLPEYTDKGYCSRLGFFHGFHLLTIINPEGIITGFGVGPASCKDQPLADAVLGARHTPDERCPFAGPNCQSGCYVADGGFLGAKWDQRWRERFGVQLLCPPRSCDAKRRRWPKALRRWQAGLRQMIETVHDKLLNTFRLAKERPHDIRGFFTRLSAKIAMHNFCIYLNKRVGRESLRFADLIGW